MRPTRLPGMNRRLLVTILGLAALLGGCNSTSDDSAASSTAATGDPTTNDTECAPTGRAVNAETIRGAVALDYQPLSSLTEAVATVADVAVAGRVTAWRSGPTSETDGRSTRSAILVVEVLHATEVVDEAQRTEVQVRLHRRIPVTPPTTTSPWGAETLEELDRAAPVGTCVLIVASAPADDGAEGPVLVNPLPQGFLLQTADGATASVRVPDDEVHPWTSHAAGVAGSTATNPDSPGSFQNLVDELVALG